MKEKELAQKIISHIEEISGGLYTLNQSNVKRVDFIKYIFDLECYIGCKINPILVEVWNRFNGCSFNNDIGIKPDDRVPTLGDGELIELTRFFSIESTGDDVLEMLRSNADIFGKEYIPFAEAIEGDFFVLSSRGNGIYYVLHDFNEDEKCFHRVADTISDFFMAVQLMVATEKIDNEKMRIVSSSLSSPLLSKLKKKKITSKKIYP